MMCMLTKGPEGRRFTCFVFLLLYECDYADDIITSFCLPPFEDSLARGCK